MLAKLLSDSWWILLARGTLAVLFGMCAYVWPGLTLATLVSIFAAFAVTDGILGVLHGVRGRQEHEHWCVLTLEGLLGVAFGAVAFLVPGITAVVLGLYIGFWAITGGVLRIILAVRVRKEIEGEWWMVVCGLTGIALGLLIVARPRAGALGMLWPIGTWALVGGMSLIVLSVRLKTLSERLDEVKEKFGTLYQGDAATISGYLGKSDAFDQAIGEFALAYADQTARDHAALVAAVKAGRVKARREENR
jgi:uncharacterized membrane protein HdeD (DUF308 family)